MRTINEIFASHKKGHKLTDDELIRLAVLMESIADASVQVGDIFLLQTAFAAEVARDCRHILRARRANAGRA